MNMCRASFEALLDFQEGRSDEAVSEQINQHLAHGCAHCQNRLVLLKRILTALLHSERFHAPETVLIRARALFRKRMSAPVDAPLLARLVFDSRSHSAFVGARGESSASFQLLFCTDNHDIDLWEEQLKNGEWYLIGQVLPKQGGKAIIPDIAVLVSGEEQTLTATSEKGEFHLSSVPPGTYDLYLRFHEMGIVVPELVIGS